MGYLIAQVFVCLLVAFGLGLLLGRLLWHGAREAAASPDEGALEAARQRIRTLEADLADCRAVDPPPFAQPAPTPLPTPPPMAPPPAPPAGEAGGVLGFGPPAAAPVDDLTRISGVGPVIEKQLAGLGIVRFRQIADFTPDVSRRVGEALGVFSDRIDREDWVAQAKHLHAETDGDSD